MTIPANDAAPIFDPRAQVPVLALPEGTRSLGFFARWLLSKGERTYDQLWRYVKKVNRSQYAGQTAGVRFGEYYMGLRAPNRIPSFINFKTEEIMVGKKLTIPFHSVRGLLAGHGMLPWRKTPLFVLLIKVDGCQQFIPIHQCSYDISVVDLADFLSSHIHTPLGIASNPLRFLILPGKPFMTHAAGDTPLYEIRGLITSRGPDERTRIKLLTGQRPITIVDSADPLGWIEEWGLVADNLISIVTRRTRSRYGRTDFGETPLPR